MRRLEQRRSVIILHFTSVISLISDISMLLFLGYILTCGDVWLCAMI